MSRRPNSPRSARIAEIVGDSSAAPPEARRADRGSLEIAVPRGQPQLAVEHRHAVAHIVEGDAQLGLTLADFVEQPGIVHRDDRLRREAFQQRDLLVGERPHFLAVRRRSAEQHVVLAQRHATARCARRRVRRRTRAIGSSDLRRQIGDMNDPLSVEQSPGRLVVGPE